MKKLLISAAKSMIPIAIVLLSLNASAFTIVKNPWPSCERPVVLIADSIYGVINTLPLQISMDEKDHNGNMYSVFAMSPAYLGNTTVFTELGTVTLSGILYHVFRFTYAYSLTPGRIGYLNISSKLFSGTWLMRSCPDCNVTPLSCIGRVKAIWAYLQELRTYVGNQPFASLTPGDQLNMTRLIDWYLGIDNPSPSVSDYSNLLDGQNFGNSTVPTSICSTDQHDCDYYKTIGGILDSVAQIVIDQSYNFSLISSGAQSTLFGCDYFSDYYFMVQSSEDGTQDQLFLVPLKANIPTWILHFADSSVYQLSFSYNYVGGINGLYGGSVYSNGSFTCNNGFVTYEPFQVEITSSDDDNNIHVGETLVLSAGQDLLYLWSNGSTSREISVQPLVNTMYSVTVTDSISGCESADSVLVKIISASSQYQQFEIDFKLKNTYDYEIMLSSLPTELALIAAKYGIISIEHHFASQDSNLKRIYAVQLNPTFSNPGIADSIRLDSLIAELNNIQYIEYAEKVPAYSYYYTFNDPEWLGGNQWSYNKINANPAMDFVCSHSNYSPTIAILDNGFLITHEDLASNIDLVGSWDIANNDASLGNPSGNSHGTHVAGIVGAVSNNGLGVSSLSDCGNGLNHPWLMLLKISFDGSLFPDAHSLESGIVWAVDNGADIINLSLGAPWDPPSQGTITAAINYAYSNNVLVIAAAGNDGEVYPKCPCYLDSVLCVGATEQNDHPGINFSPSNYFLSNFGDQIHVMAPGCGIISTLYDNNSSYGMGTGTSMASPMVASLAGLALTAFPTLPNEALLAAIENSCDNIDAINAYPLFGNDLYWSGYPMNNAPHDLYHGNLGNGRINAGEMIDFIRFKMDPVNNDRIGIHPANHCINQPVHLYYCDATVTDATTYQWTIPGASFISSSNIQCPLISFPAPGSYIVTVVLDGGVSTYSQQINFGEVLPSVFIYSLNNLDNNSCSGSIQSIGVNFEGRPPFEIELTDGVNNYIFDGFMQHQETIYLPVTLPSNNISVLSVSDKYCVSNNGNSISFQLKACCDNLIQNSSFEDYFPGIPPQPFPVLGPIGFYSDYPYNNGYATINIIPEDIMSSYGDNHAVSPLDGIKMLYCDGFTPGMPIPVVGGQNGAVWQSQELAVIPNQDYYFSLWVNNIWNPIKLTDYRDLLVGLCDIPGVSFIAVDPMGNEQSLLFESLAIPTVEHFLPIQPERWTHLAGIWNSGFNNATIHLELRNTVTTSQGNDFVIDFIEFRRVNSLLTTVDMISDVTYCGGSDGSATVTVTNGLAPYLYLWSNSCTTQTCTGLSEGNYSVTVSDADGCTSSASVFINAPDNISVNIINTNPSCFNEGDGSASVDVVMGTLPFDYLWSNLSTNQTISNLLAGNYCVTVTDGSGCTGSACTSITSPSELIASISNQTNVSCTGLSDGSATVNTIGGTPNYSYIWSDPSSQTTQTATGLLAGNYCVTVIDANGCNGSVCATITEVDPLSISIDVSNALCSCNGGALAMVSGGTAPYTYLWSGGIQGPDNYISSLCGGTTYSVTVTDANSCTATADILVNWIEEPPSVAITHSGCYDMCFQNSAFSTPAITGASYLWDFGDGSTSNLQNPQHSFPDIGYHCVSLSVTNSCGTTNQSVPLSVTEYACVCDYNYDFVGPYELQANTTWNSSNFSQGVYITGDLIVPRNITLNIDQIPVYFSPTGRIIVAEDGPQAPSVNGGQLIISNAALLTSLPATCNKYMWKGIEVWGIPSHDQYIEHGTVYITDNAIIENAHIAVLSGARNDEVICDPSQTIFDLSKSGGVVRLYHAVFDRNGVDIKFLYKQNPSATENKVVSSVFRCGNPGYASLWDGHYSSANANPYPNTHNPWAGNTMQYQWTGAFGGPMGNSMQSTHAAIEIDHNRGIDIGHNSFYHKEYAIRTSDAQYDVIGNTFNNVQYGIYMLNPSQTLLNMHNIADNTFDMIPGMMGINGTGIFNLCGNLDVINNNQFKNTLYGNCDEAMKFLFSSRYKITENRFDRYVHGVIANWNFSGLIGPEGSLYEGNYFEGFSTSIETTGANASLALRCNDFYPLVGANIENWVNNAVVLGNWVFTLGNQGINYPDPRALAGNTFNYPTQKEITSSHSYRYYHHDPSIPKFVPVNTPHIISITTPGFPGHYYAVPYSSDMVSCPPLTGTPVPFPNELRFNEAPYDQLLNYKMKTDSLSQVRDVMISQLDRGETSSLLDAVANISDQGILKNLLSDHSPLSDTVLTSIIEHNVFSPGNYKLVMQKNLPVSLNIEPDFFAYLGSMPPGIADQLKALQAVNVNATTPTTIQRQIDESRTSYNLLFNDVLFVLTDSSHIMTDVAIQLLEWDATPESKYVLLSHYLNTGDFVSATHKLSELNALTDPVSAQLYDLYQVLFPLYFSGGDYRNIDSTGLVYIRNLAWSCPETPAVYIARGIIDILLNEKVPACPPETYNRRFDPIVQQNCEKQNPFLGDNYPNPFSQVTKIPYYMPENNTGMIIIRNLIGIELKQFDCSAGFNVIEMNGEDIESGLYLYSLVINGQSNATKKMIIVK